MKNLPKPSEAIIVHRPIRKDSDARQIGRAKALYSIDQYQFAGSQGKAKPMEKLEPSDTQRFVATPSPAGGRTIEVLWRKLLSTLGCRRKQTPTLFDHWPTKGKTKTGASKAGRDSPPAPFPSVCCGKFVLRPLLVSVASGSGGSETLLFRSVIMDRF